MVRNLAVSGVMLGLFLAGVTSADSVSVQDSGFEQPNLGNGANAYEYGYSAFIVSGHSADLSGTGWTFNGGAGIAANGSAFGVTGATGNQAAFLQYGSTSFFYQPITLPQAGGVQVSFDEEARGNYGNGGLPFNLVLTIYTAPFTFDPTTTYSNSVPFPAPTDTSKFVPASADFGLLGPGKYELVFQGTSSPFDETTFIDNVNVALTPAPAAFSGGLAIVALIGLGGLCRHLKIAIRRQYI